MWKAKRNNEMFLELHWLAEAELSCVWQHFFVAAIAIFLDALASLESTQVSQSVSQ